jgi:hypothetical protein
MSDFDDDDFATPPASTSVPDRASHPKRKVRARVADMIGGGTAYAGSKPTAEPECNCPNEFVAKNHPRPDCDVHGDFSSANKPSFDSDKTPKKDSCGSCELNEDGSRTRNWLCDEHGNPPPTMTKPDKAPLRNRIAGKLASKTKDSGSAPKPPHEHNFDCDDFCDK